MSSKRPAAKSLDEAFTGLTDTERLDKAWRMLAYLEVTNQAIRAGQHAVTPAAALWVDSAAFTLRMILDGRHAPRDPKNPTET